MDDWWWPIVLPLLVLNGVTTLLALYSDRHAAGSRRRLVMWVWLLPVIGAVLALIAGSRRKPPAARLSVSRTRGLHYGNGYTVWSSGVAYRYQSERDHGGEAGGGWSGGGSSDAGSGGDGGCGGDGGACH